MNSKTGFNHTVTIGIAAAVVLVASFMAWGHINVASMGGGFPLFPGGGSMSVNVNAWNGNVTLLGLTLPNWLTVFAAAGAIALSWMRSTGAWTGHSAVQLGCGIYGLLHSGLAVIVFLGSSEASLGIGCPATMAAFVAIVVASFRQLAEPANASDSGVPETPANPETT